MKNTTYLIFSDEKITSESGGSFNYVEPVHKMKGTKAEVKKYIKENLPAGGYKIVPLTAAREKAGPPYFEIRVKDNNELSDAEKEAIREIEKAFEPLKDMFNITITTSRDEKE